MIYITHRLTEVFEIATDVAIMRDGLITLSEDAGLTATVLDIEENPHNYKITELEAAQVSISLPDVDIILVPIGGRPPCLSARGL